MNKIFEPDQPMEPSATEVFRSTGGSKGAAPAAGASRAWRGGWRALAFTLLALLLLQLALMLYWGRQPATFDIAERTQAELAELARTDGAAPPGTTLTATIIGVGETLLQKPGGFMHNDRLPPGVLMDNAPSWECGVVMALRDVVQALRDDFTRSQSQSIESLHVKRADMQFAMDPKSWMLPAPEQAYREGIVALRAYLADLAAGRAGFYARADNLADYLGLVEKRLGNFGVRLGAASVVGLTGVGVPPVRSSGNPTADPGATPVTRDDAGMGAALVFDAVDPSRVDDVFFCARGYSWALLHLMRAAQVDFAAVLADKNAEVQVQQITGDLQGAIKRMRSPVVLNGGGFGLLANHSMVAASYVSRVNAAVIDLRLLLEQG
jgi:hypothetical protein